MRFSKAEEKFLKRKEIGRFATISPDGMPHVVPVCYVYAASKFLIAVDYGTKKYRNLLGNNRVALVVDVQDQIRGVLVRGKGEVLEKGPEFRRTYSIFYRRFSWVRADPWKEGEAPFVMIRPAKKASWGLR